MKRDPGDENLAETAGLPFEESWASGMVWTFLMWALPAEVKRMI